MEKFKQVCPLCKSIAEFYFVDHADKKYFSCPICKRYQICNAAEIFISDATEEIRKKTSEYAQQSAENEATVISLETILPNKKLTIAHVKRAELSV